MADDDGTTVEVDETTVEAPDAVVEASPTIVVDAGDDGASPAEVAAEVDAAVEQERRFAAIEETQRAQAQAIEELRAHAYTTEVVQEATVEAVVATAEEVSEQGDALAETIEDEIPEEVGEDPRDDAPTSAREHWWFRNRRN